MTVRSARAYRRRSRSTSQVYEELLRRAVEYHAYVRGLIIRESEQIVEHLLHAIARRTIFRLSDRYVAIRRGAFLLHSRERRQKRHIRLFVLFEVRLPIIFCLGKQLLVVLDVRDRVD